MHHRKVFLFGLLLAGILLSGCISQTSFDQEFPKVRAIMERNGAFFPKTLVPPSIDLINRTQFELEAYKSALVKQPESQDKKAVTAFLTAHNHLLEMQKQFLEGGTETSLTDFTLISCEKGSNLSKAITHYELAAVQADLAEKNFAAFENAFSVYAGKTEIDYTDLENELKTSKATFLELKSANQKLCS